MLPISSLVRADYHGSDPTQVREAVEGYRTDILAPLIADEMRIRRPLGLDSMRLFAPQIVQVAQRQRVQAGPPCCSRRSVVR